MNLKGEKRKMAEMDNQKIATYEVFIQDMLNVFKERYTELSQNKKLSEFQEGRKLAYWEILDIIKTRKDLISEMLEED